MDNIFDEMPKEAYINSNCSFLFFGLFAIADFSTVRAPIPKANISYYSQCIFL